MCIEYRAPKSVEPQRGDMCSIRLMSTNMGKLNLGALQSCPYAAIRSQKSGAER